MEDMIKGFCQAYTGASNYLSRSYVKYKANYMNRFTTKTYTKGTKNIPSASVKNAGTKLQAFTGVSIANNNTKQVNMMLTGQTIKGLEYKSSTQTSLTMSYKEKDTKKIEGNERLGRFITTLNEVNQAKAVKMIEEEIYKNIQDWEKTPIKITIGR